MDHVKGALGPLLPKVDELLKLVECKMQIDLNKEVEPPEPDWDSVKTELVSLQSQLQYLKTEGRYIEVELGKSPSSRLAIKVWAEIRELSYDVEDVVDNYLLCLEGSEPIPDIDTLKQLVQKMTELDLWEKIPADAMINDAAAARPASTRSIDPKGQAMYTDIPHLVGIRGSMDSLIDMISDVKITTVTSEMSEENSSDKFSSKYTDWGIPDNSQYKDQNLPSKKKPRIASHIRFGDKGKTTLVPGVLDKIKEDAPSQDSVNLEISDVMSDTVLPEEYSARYANLLTEVPAGTSGKVSVNDTSPIKDDSQNEDKNMPSRNKPKIACVVGFGGLGKTTLVRTLYDKIKTDFSCKAFVSVGQNGNEKKVLMDILLDLDKELKEKNYTTYGLERLDVMQLLKQLQEFLCKKRYLIVIDDIWKENLWKLIECSFRNEHQLGSQVFTTTRSLNVAQACCASDDRLIYRMKPLSDEDSKSLFYRRVFSHEGGECPPCLNQVSAAIMKKCGGVPLAIITIASLLASTDEGIKPMDEWNHVLNSIGRGLTEGDSVVEMNRILSLSYNDLPPELKNCLLYMVVFPEDYVIKKDRLVSLWIGEGFVQRANPEDSLFEVAEKYFNMLINRSMIEAVNIDGEGKANACRIHDMVLGFLCSLSSEANFVTIIDGSNQTASESETKFRRITIQDNCMAKEPVVTGQLSQVRSFTLWSSTFQDHEVDNHAIDLEPRHSTFQVLRVLDLKNFNFRVNFHQTNPLYEKSLLHARYIGLRGVHIMYVQTYIGKLKFLQILDLRYNITENLPPSIVELRQLICLRVHQAVRLPDEFGKLTSLEELSHVKVNRDSAYVAKQLGYLTKLRVLRISPEDFESLTKEFIESLNKMPEIRSIEFQRIGVFDFNEATNSQDFAFDEDSCDRRFPYEEYSNAFECLRHMGESWKPSSHLQKFRAESDQPFPVMPNWITESSNISYLTICLKKVRKEDIEILGGLHFLRCLNLRQDATSAIYLAQQDDDIEFENDVFPVLRQYRVLRSVTLPSMFPRGAMPKVEILEFHVRLEDFGKMNLKMGHLPALKQVKVVIWYNELDSSQVKDAKVALRAAADSHPNRPTIHINEKSGFSGNRYEYEIETKLSLWPTGDEEATKQQLHSSDAEAVDVQASHQPLRPSESCEASGFPSMPPLDPYVDQDKSTLSLWPTGDEEAKKQQLRSSEAEAADVQASHQLRPTEIGEASGFPSVTPLDPYEDQDKSWLSLWTTDDEEAAKQKLCSSDVETVDFQASNQPLCPTEIGEASAFFSLLPLDLYEVQEKCLLMWMNDDKEAVEQQLCSSGAEAVNVQASHQPLRPTEIGDPSGFPSLPPLDLSDDQDKSWLSLWTTVHEEAVKK